MKKLEFLKKKPYKQVNRLGFKAPTQFLFVFLLTTDDFFVVWDRGPVSVLGVQT